MFKHLLVGLNFTQKYFYTFIHFLYPLLPYWVTGELVPISSSLRTRGGVHPGQVASPPQGNKGLALANPVNVSETSTAEDLDSDEWDRCQGFGGLLFLNLYLHKCTETPYSQDINPL
ncbi:hypothetical protein CHARACLAT_001018 [Characodon lateralis]|uniref:Uncharacterized protein n=1 Tax=Characodon lateralis TaxID=208331 RepID=A0ABU7EZK6_9TELE|nr:hypothetical protein [Characodon lateralis]